MLKFYSDTKIYVHCPSGMVTGGAELLHQLVSYLRNNSKDAYIVYFGGNKHEIPSDYQSYNIALSEIVEDNEHNIEILYEGIYNWIHLYKHIQKFLWWISVDNFYICAKDYLSLNDLYRWNKLMWWQKVKDRTKLLLKGHHPYRNVISIKKMVDMNCVCGYQAEYIQHYLQDCGFKELVALKDYINIDHCSSFSKEGRENIVVYNPKKGLEYTKKLIEASPDLTWIPLQGMTRQQLIETIRKAKVYVDFGNHPGKDRLPRECAMNGCCIITGKRGSAGFFEDVAVPSKYKFEENCANILDIINSIKYVISHYDSVVNEFSFYRNIIRQEKEEFEQQVENLFDITKKI